MKRLGAALAAAALVLLGSSPVRAAEDPTTIEVYDAHFVVEAGGQMEVVETLTLDFPAARHGLVRSFTHAGEGIDDIPGGIEVQRDGKDEPFTEAGNDGGGRDLRIGDPAKTLTGKHRYRIRYVVQQALSPGGTSPQDVAFSWNLVPGRWTLPITRAHLVVDLPAAAQDVRCAIGTGQSDGCEAAGEGTRTLTVRTGALAPRTPVTVRAVLTLPEDSSRLPVAPPSTTAPATPDLPAAVDVQQEEDEPMPTTTGEKVVTVALVALVLVGLGAGTYLWRRRRRSA